MSEHRDLVSIFQEHATPYEESPSGLTWGFRSVHPDLRSRNGFRYPWPGGWAKSPDDGRPLTKGDACPSATVGGLCAAKTAYGAAQGGIPLSTVLLVGWRPDDVLGEDDHKVRLVGMYVADVLDVPGLARAGHLSGADLHGADLSRADLSRAYLSRADLSRAYLSGADLSRADLSRAYLSRADLSGAYPSRAYLSRAYLSGADLSGADLSRADLSRAQASDGTIWPSGFDAKAAGVIIQ